MGCTFRAGTVKRRGTRLVHVTLCSMVSCGVSMWPGGVHRVCVGTSHNPHAVHTHTQTHAHTYTHTRIHTHTHTRAHDDTAIQANLAINIL